MWNLPAPPGFSGFDPLRPVRIYQRNLPHWRQQGATYFVTFRLADSLPEERLLELRALRAKWEQHHPQPRADADWAKLARITFEHVERWLDDGAGSCLLEQPFVADIVERKLRHYDGQKYELGAYVLMPNHVHAIVRPLSDREYPLEKIEQAWKGFSSREIQAAGYTNGQLWQFESYDRIVRDEEHLFRCLQYLGDNPRRAGLAPGRTRRWLSPQWTNAGWNFDVRET